MSTTIETFRANLAKAIRDRTTLTVGGGKFSGVELKSIQAALGTPASPMQIEAARANYAAGSDDNIEVDDDARVSRIDGTDAYWVSAWVYLSGEES